MSSSCNDGRPRVSHTPRSAPPRTHSPTRRSNKACAAAPPRATRLGGGNRRFGALLRRDAVQLVAAKHFKRGLVRVGRQSTRGRARGARTARSGSGQPRQHGGEWCCARNGAACERANNRPQEEKGAASQTRRTNIIHAAPPSPRRSAREKRKEREKERKKG